MSINFLDPSVELILEDDPFKKIELAGRTCYKSESSITSESSKKFVKNLMKNQHMAMVEHANVVFSIDCNVNDIRNVADYVNFLEKSRFLQVTVEPDYNRILVSGSVRAILERKIDDPIYRALIRTYVDFEDDTYRKVMYEDVYTTVSCIENIKNLTFREFMNHFFISMIFITDRGVSHEIVRHRLFSFAQESTRYCNYSKDKFGGHLVFCRPSTYETWTKEQRTKFESMLSQIDETYNFLTSSSDAVLQPQQARAILPNCLKTEIVVSGPAYEWKHFFDLRSTGTTGSPHPDIKVVADEARTKINNHIKTLNFETDFRF